MLPDEPIAARLEAPPQPPAGMHLLGPGEKGCPTSFELCADRASATKLLLYLQAVQRWENEAWLRCGPAPTSPAGSTSTTEPPRERGRQTPAQGAEGTSAARPDPAFSP